MLRRLLLVVVFCLLYSTPAWATRQRLFGYCQQGGTAVTVPGTAGSGTQRFQQTYRGCTVTIYLTGTSTTVSLYSDDTGTAQANPFTASSTTGFWSAYVDGGRFDIRYSGGGISTPFTISDYRVPNDVFDVTDFGAKCDGSTNDYTAVNNARIAATGQTNGGTVLIPSNVTGTCLINTSITFDADVTLAFEGGGRIAMASATTATIAGSIQAPRSQIFTTGGDILFTGPVVAYPEWWGASNAGVTDGASAIQDAVDAVCAYGGDGFTMNTAGAHTKLIFSSGVYRINAQVTIPAGCFAEFEGGGWDNTFIYQRGGSGAAIQYLGSRNVTTAVRTDSDNDGAIYIHDMSIGSNTGHALSCRFAYQSIIRNVHLFSADTASNFMDFDGCSVQTVDYLRIAGNLDFPYEATLLTAREQGIYGVYITKRQYAGPGDLVLRWNASGEFWFTNLMIEGQQTQDGMYVYQTSTAATDSGTIFPVYVDGGEFVIIQNYAGYRQDGQVIAKVSDVYGEGATGVTTCDTARIDSTQGAGELTVSDSFSPSCRIHFAGDGVSRPSLIARGNLISTFVSSSGTYGVLDMRENKLTTDTASTAANYTAGQRTYLLGNVVINTGTGAVSASLLDGTISSGIGTPTDALFALRVNNATRWFIDDSAAAYSLKPNADNANDIGSAANAVRTAYVDTSVITPLVGTATDALLGFMVNNANRWFINDSAGSYALTPNSDRTVNIGSLANEVQDMFLGRYLNSGGVTFANLGTPTNGAIVYCSDCNKATPCTGGGAGAIAKRLGAAWDCD